MPRKAAGSHHGHGKNDRLALQHISPRIIPQSLPRLKELGGGKSKAKGKSQDDQMQTAQTSMGESPALLSPINEGRENPIVPPFPPLTTSVFLIETIMRAK